MPILLLAFAFIGLTWLSHTKGWSRVESFSRIGFFAALIVWLWISAEKLQFENSEEALLLWFAYGLGVALVAEALQLFRPLKFWSVAALPTIALQFALGLDVFRPNAYAYAPASILAILVSLVAIRAAQRLSENIEEQRRGGNRAIIVISTISVAMMLYSAFFKMMDRNWLLPWSYLIGIGALLWTLSRLWMAWDMVLGKPIVQSRNSQAVYQLGSLLIVAAAFFHYQQYFN